MQMMQYVIPQKRLNSIEGVSNFLKEKQSEYLILEGISIRELLVYSAFDFSCFCQMNCRVEVFKGSSSSQNSRQEL